MNFFMSVVGVLLAGYLVCVVLSRFPRIRKSLVADEDAFVLWKKGFWSGVWADREMRKRLLVTVGAVFLYRVLTFIPLPGLNMDSLHEFFRRLNDMAGAGLLNVRSVVDTSMVYQKFSLFNLGLWPFLSACILVQVITFLIPPLKRVFFDPEKRWLFRQATFVTTLVIGGGIAFFHAFQMEKTMIGKVMIVSHSGWVFRSVAVLSMVSALCLLLVLANWVTRKGIGQGVAIIVGSDVVIKIVLSVKHILSGVAQGVFSQAFYILVFVMIFIMMGVALFLTLWRRHMTFAIGECKAWLPLRLSWLGRLPWTLAMVLVMIPLTMSYAFPQGNLALIAKFLHKPSIGFYIAMIVLTGMISYVYMALLVGPESLTKKIRAYGGQIEGAEDEAKTEDLFYERFEGLTFVIFIVFLFLGAISDVIMFFMKVPYVFASLFGAGAVLLFMGIIADTIENIKAKMQKKSSGNTEVCTIAPDEIEANLQACYLRSNGVACVIEPLRFTWGLPIKTIVDEYRICVAQDQVGRARVLLASEKDVSDEEPSDS